MQNEIYISKCKTNKSLATAKQPKSEPPHPQIYIAGQTLTARAAGIRIAIGFNLFISSADSMFIQALLAIYMQFI